MKDGPGPAHYFGPRSSPTPVSRFHRLDAAADARFLRAGVADPLTRVPFRPANEVVLCATCGTVSLRETWEAIGGCPNGHATPAVWDADAALAGGDGGLTPRPAAPTAARTAPAAAEPASKNRTPLLIAAGVAALVVGGIVGAGLIGGDDEAAPVETVDDAPPAEATGPQAVVAEAGETAGSLSESDFRGEDGRYRDLYTFAADSSGRVLSFSLTSDAFTPDLYVETPQGDRVEAETLTDNEESVARTVAVRNLRGPGLYRVFLSSRRPGETGAYTLQIRQEDPIRPLTAGAAPFAAELGTFSEKVDGFNRDRYRFEGVTGREHTVTVRSSAFAPTVAVTGPGGAVRGESGRAGGSVTYTFTPEQDGTYTLVVSSQSRDRTGAYTVQLAVAAAPPAEEALPVQLIPATGVPIADSLSAGQTEAYGFRGRLGDRVQLEVRAEGFTPTLALVGPDGARVPAEPDGDRARIRFTLPSEGVYRVLVGTQGGGGAYRLVLEKEAAVTGADIPRQPVIDGAP